MVRYYAYNPKKRGSKYVEITEEQYLNVKIQPNRWFISFGNCVLECEKSEYDEYYRQREHYLYTLRNASGKRPDILSLEAMDDDVSYEISVFSVHTEQSVEDAAEVSLQKQQIRQAFRHLSEEEIYLIRELLIYCPLLQSTTRCALQAAQQPPKPHSGFGRGRINEALSGTQCRPAVKDGGLQIVITICNSA